MTEYVNYGLTITKAQAEKIYRAHRNGNGSVIRISKNNLHGNFKIPLTQTQVNKIKKANSGVQLELSAAQLKHMERTGGFLPLLTLIPLIAGALGAAGGLTGGIASAVSAAKSNAEQARHNRAVEEQLKSGAGVVPDLVGKVPVIGMILGPLLQKIGLGINDSNKIMKGSCVCHSGLKMKKIGNGLYLEPEGSGVFLDPRRG